VIGLSAGFPTRAQGPNSRTGSSDSSAADDQAKTKEKEKPKTEIAVFGGGCFWSIEAIFERARGVKSVVSGFSGGNVPNPDYETVCTGRTGHAEVVRIEYDPSVVSFEKLLRLFWMSHDPTTWNRQGDDFGPQYRSIILYQDEAQKEAVLKSYHELTKRRVFGAPIVTELVPFRAFYPAEPYHQNYFRNQRYSDYSLTYIVPKLRKLHLMK
jgi:peptide-methionine (S)-S-oxide reductase